MLTSELLNGIVFVLSLIEGRISPPIDFHIIASPDADMHQHIYIIDWHIPGADFHLAVRMIKALLLAHGYHPAQPNDSQPAYEALPIGLELPFLILGSSNYHRRSLQRCAEFAAVLRFSKSKNHYRYKKNEGGQPVGDYIEHPHGFSAGKDILLLATMIEMLVLSLGGSTYPALEDRKYGYWYFEDAVTTLEEQQKPPVTPVDNIDTRMKAIEQDLASLKMMFQLLLEKVNPT